MSYSAIRRGPMGGDQYTQMHNHVFRDRRLTPNAVTVFGWLSTHSEGWETSVKGIARERGLGESLVKAALACLKEHHYVVWGQDPGEGGKFGAGWYFVTDLPAQLAALGVDDPEVVRQSVADALAEWISGNRRSAPVSSEAPTVPPAKTSGIKAAVRTLRTVRA